MKKIGILAALMAAVSLFLVAPAAQAATNPVAKAEKAVASATTALASINSDVARRERSVTAMQAAYDTYSTQVQAHCGDFNLTEGNVLQRAQEGLDFLACKSQILKPLVSERALKNNKASLARAKARQAAAVIRLDKANAALAAAKAAQPAS